MEKHKLLHVQNTTYTHFIKTLELASESWLVASLASPSQLSVTICNARTESWVGSEPEKEGSSLKSSQEPVYPCLTRHGF